MQLALTICGFIVALNVAFYFLSNLYFQDRARRYGLDELTHIGGVRTAFAMFSISVGVTSILAALAPRWFGHGIPAVAGLASLVAAFASWSAGLQPTLWIALLIVGMLLPAVTWLSFQKSRAAWSFLVALCSVLALMLLFGAPKVRGIVGVGLWHTLILPGMLAVGAMALVMVHRDYVED